MVLVGKDTIKNSLDVERSKQIRRNNINLQFKKFVVQGSTVSITSLQSLSLSIHFNWTVNAFGNFESRLPIDVGEVIWTVMKCTRERYLSQ